MSQSRDESPAAVARFTQTQGQYLAFIYAYSRIFKRPPAEADMRRHFDVTAPSVHQMVMTLEKAGLISRTPGAARSIQLLVSPERFRFCAKTTRHNLCGTVLGGIHSESRVLYPGTCNALHRTVKIGDSVVPVFCEPLNLLEVPRIIDGLFESHLNLLGHPIVLGNTESALLFILLTGESEANFTQDVEIVRPVACLFQAQQELLFHRLKSRLMPVEFVE